MIDSASSSIVRQSEGRMAEELERIKLEAADIEETISSREALLAEHRSVLRQFDVRYRETVGARFAQLDALEADIAEALADLSPNNAALREKARELRARATESAAALKEELAEGADGTSFSPSDDLRRLYRRVALAMHPDLCSNENEIQLRHELMVEANIAYNSGDHGWLEAMLEGGGSVKGESAEAGELAWARIRLARAKQRLARIDRDLAMLESSDLFRLWQAVDAASSAGQDALRDLAASLDRSIRRARNRHEVLAAAVADMR